MAVVQCTIFPYSGRDLAEERGHTQCVEFFNNPMKAYMEDRKLRNTVRETFSTSQLCSFSHFLEHNMCMIILLCPAMVTTLVSCVCVCVCTHTRLQEVVVGLGMFMSAGSVDPKASKGKKKRSFSFLSKIKVG